MRKLLRFTLLALIVLGGEHLQAQTTPNPSVIKKLLRKPKSTSSTRPMVPPMYDYIECTFWRNQLQINYPDNSLPATINLTDADTGFSCYSTTAVNAGPIELNLNPGEYTLYKGNVRLTDAVNIKPTFEKLSYNMNSFWNGISFKDNRTHVFDFMKEGLTNVMDKAPVLLSGVPENPNSTSHIWVADGFVERTKYPKGHPELSQEADPLIRMVWGWGGRANGYFTYFRSSDSLSDTAVDGTDKVDTYMNLNVYGRLKPNK